MKSQHWDKLSRREFLKLLGAGAATATLAACAPAVPAPQPTSPPPAPSVAPVKPTAPPAPAISIQFWDMVNGPPEYIDTGKKLVEQFNQQSTSAKAVYQSTPWTNWYQTFLTAIGSGTAPDISTGAGYQAVQFYTQGAILEIDDVIADLKSAGKDKDFMPGTLERLQYQGHTVALPWGIDVRIPFYRKDLFDKAGVKPPTTWAEFRAAAKSLTSGNQYGFVMAGASPLGMHLLLALMINNGSGVFGADGKLNMMSDRNSETMTFLSNLVKDGSVHPGSAGFSSDDARKAFATGAAAIMMMDAPAAEKRYPDLGDKVGMLAPLAGPHGDKGTLSWVNNIMLYKQGKNPAATKTFLKWWSENAKPLWTEGHCTQIPARLSIAADPYFQNNPYTKQILEQWIPISKSTGALSSGIFPALNDLEGDGVMITLAQDVLQGKDVKESMLKAEARIKTILKM